MKTPADGKVKCPYCGSTIFGRTVPVTGTWYQSFELTTEGELTVLDGTSDGVHMGREPRTVICEKCMRRQPNPTLNHTTLYAQRNLHLTVKPT